MINRTKRHEYIDTKDLMINGFNRVMLTDGRLLLLCPL